MADWWNDPLFGVFNSPAQVALNLVAGGDMAVAQEASDRGASPLEAGLAGAFTPLYGLTGGFGRDSAEAIAKGAEQYDKKNEEAQAQLAAAGQQAQGGLNPYAQLGTDSVAAQRALAGLDGPEAQRAAITQLQASPQFQAQLEAGNQNILANASATGGLRGGNTQAALGQFAPQLLNSLIEQQMARLGGFAQAGQGAAAQQGAFGLNAAGMRGDLLQSQGQGQAQSTIGQQAAIQQGRQQAFDTGLGILGAGGQLLAGMPPSIGGGQRQQAQPFSPYAPENGGGYQYVDSNPVGQF